MSDEGGSGEFLFRVPVWVPINEPTFRTNGLLGAVVKVTSVRGLIVPLFTDEDLGQRFVQGMTDRAIHAIHEKKQLAALLKLLKIGGVTYVGFDCLPIGQPAGGFFFPIDVVISIAEQDD